MPRERKSRNPRRQTHPTPRDSGLRSPGMERPLLPNASGTGAVKLPITSPAQDGPPRPDRLTPVRLSAIRPAGRIHSSRCRTTGSLVASLRPSWGAHTPAGEPAANSCLSLISRGGGGSIRASRPGRPHRPFPVGLARSATRPIRWSRMRRWNETAGGARRDRTDDLMLAKHALSQLSYCPGPGRCPRQKAQPAWRRRSAATAEARTTSLHGLACMA